MTEEKQSASSSGVQQLVDRIRNQGVQAANEQANKILREAETKAAAILAEARAEVAQLREQTRAELKSERSAALEALKLSARDTMLQLKAKVSSEFEVFVKRLVTSATKDEEFIKSIVLVLAGHVQKEFIRDNDIEILISETVLNNHADETLRERGKQAVLTLSSEMLRAGVELIPSSDIEGGARVRLVEDKLEIDLSDKAVAKLLYQRILPRFRAILEGNE